VTVKRSITKGHAFEIRIQAVRPLVAYKFLTDSLCKTIIVRTPNIVPYGIKMSSEMAMIKLNIRFFLFFMNIPDMIWKMPNIMPSNIRTPNRMVKMAKIALGNSGPNSSPANSGFSASVDKIANKMK
jgi:hypothetical protein